MQTQTIKAASPPQTHRAIAELAMPSPVLAIVYAAGQEADTALARFADLMRSSGVAAVGIVQRNPEVPGRSRCNMEVEILPGGVRLLISEDRGAGARGCRMEPGLLVRALAQARANLDAGADVLILNRFGKLEAEGSGGRDLIAAAVMQDIPVIVAVPWRNIDAFRVFAGEFASEMQIATFNTWLEEVSESKLLKPAVAKGNQAQSSRQPRDIRPRAGHIG